MVRSVALCTAVPKIKRLEPELASGCRTLETRFTQNHTGQTDRSRASPIRSLRVSTRKVARAPIFAAWPGICSALTACAGPRASLTARTTQRFLATAARRLNALLTPSG